MAQLHGNYMFKVISEAIVSRKMVVFCGQLKIILVVSDFLRNFVTYRRMLGIISQSY